PKSSRYRGWAGSTTATSGALLRSPRRADQQSGPECVERQRRRSPSRRDRPPSRLPPSFADPAGLGNPSQDRVGLLVHLLELPVLTDQYATRDPEFVGAAIARLTACESH